MSKRRAIAKRSGKTSGFGPRAPSGQLADVPNQRSGSAEGSKRSPGLYVVATPIGNAADITLRALDLIAQADVVACEDTRETGKLLALHGVRARLMAYHDHNAERVRPTLLTRLKAGETVALVSDAGTPLVSDPGYKLVAEAIALGVRVSTAPGPSAALAALTVSGLPPQPFLFAAYPSPRSTARRRGLAEVKDVKATLVFFESPRRLAGSLADMAAVLGDRQAAVARELTKLFEEVRRGRLSELAAYYRSHGAPKGEVVVVVAPPEEQEPSAAELDRRLRQALATMTLREAATAVREITGASRRRVYARALRLTAG